jgi:hypothetical protein
MNSILVYLILLYLIAFTYDKVIDDVIKSNPTLTTRLTEFKYFYSFQSRPKALYSALSFQFWGISSTLNITGSVFSLMMYFGLVVGAYSLIQSF